ncbi:MULTISPECIES: hypothetical protein [unclassified Streptomyces]|nr:MULTISPECIES: hypothetical protein [unclassified Streptomyces]
MIYVGKDGDESDEGVPEFHFVDDVLYLCHEGDHYCAAGALPDE